MLNFLKKSAPTTDSGLSVRDTLFGDRPWTAWPPHSNTATLAPPWTLFAEARLSWEAGDKHRAATILQEITQQHGLESRHYLQAWHFLHDLGIKPPADIEKMLYGVVVEVAIGQGVDLLAAYLDGSARYYNHAGGGIVWEHPNDQMDGHIERLFEASRHVVEQIGFWEDPRPTAPVNDQARINFLTPGGLCFGQASMDTLSADPLARPVIHTATQLMQALIEFQEQNQS